MSKLYPVGGAPVSVVLAVLHLDGSPRLKGESQAHVQRLAEVGGGLPPILVHRQSMRVLDGMHRVRAAIVRGDSAIEAVFFDGDADAAFVEAVRANVTHGLPLTLADRKAAARRIAQRFPQWSDRAVAAASGLSPATVCSLRERVTEDSGQLHTRVGRDGRRRPVDASPGRRRAAEVLAQRPDASLREVARCSGVSVGTVRDVRRRLRAGLDPVSHPRRGGTLPAARLVAGGSGSGPRGAGGPGQARPRLPAAVLADLMRDPSLRYTESGRVVVRWLDAHRVSLEDWAELREAVPPHCASAVAELAASCAQVWAQIAIQLAAPAAAGQLRLRK
jgi:hypothetical protein